MASGIDSNGILLNDLSIYVHVCKISAHFRDDRMSETLKSALETVGVRRNSTSNCYSMGLAISFLSFLPTAEEMQATPINLAPYCSLLRFLKLHMMHVNIHLRGCVVLGSRSDF